MSLLTAASLEVSLKNYEKVFDYFERDPNKLVATLGHFAVSTIYKPDVVFENGAEEQIGDAFDKGLQGFILANHVYSADIPNLPALLWREPVFHPMLRKTNIYGKSELVSGGTKDAIFSRILFSMLGMVPLFRGKDVGENEWTEETQELFAMATERAIDLGASKLDCGFHATMFPEGERDEVLDQEKRDASIVRPLKKGFAEMIHRSEDPSNVFIITPGFSYPEPPFSPPTTKQEKSANTKTKRRPTLYIPTPTLVTEDNKDNLIPLAHASLQYAVNEAIRARMLRENPAA